MQSFALPARLHDFDEYYIDHDYLDHGYITIGYIDTTPVYSVRVVTCIHATPALTVGGKRRRPPEMQLMMTERRKRQKRKILNPVASVRFTPATTEGMLE